MKAAALLLLVPLALALAQAPTPESVLGHKPGDDFYLASYDDSLGYFQKLAHATDKLKLVRVGKTTEGRDWYIAIISSARNLADLDKYKDTAKRLALVKGLTDEQAHTLAHNGKVIVHIDAGLHSTEVAPAQMTIQLAYNLVTATDADTTAILDNVILLLWFSINPDGQNMVAKWYRGNLGTPYEVSGLPGLFQEYIGHDNNRDGYMNNMIESQVITRTELEYYPNVNYDHHQTAPFPARIWIPPFGDPVSLNPHPLMYRWVNVFGTAMAAWLDEHDMPGTMHRGRFDDWYPGFVDHVNNFRNTVSFLTETALYEYATPHFYTTNDFPAASQDLRSQVFYSSPWKGGWWRLGDAVRYTLGASMAVLDTAAKNREELLFDRYRAGRDVIARFTKDPPYAYIIPREQRDTPTAATLVEKLLIDGIEVHQATHEFTANGSTYKEGDWVVLMDQPFAALVKELFDIQKYPNLPGMPQPAGAAAAGGGGRGGGGRGAAAVAAPAAATAAPAPAAAAGGGGRGGGGGGRGGGGGGAGGAGGRGGAGGTGAGTTGAPATATTTPYDVTGWTLPIQMGVEVVAVTQPIGEATRGALHKIERVEPIQGKVEGAGPVFAFSHSSNAALRAVNEILAAGGTVSFAKSGGNIYATNAANASALLKQNGVDAKSVAEAPEAWPVKKPRIGIYQPWSGNIDEGWTRWILEQFKFPFTVLHNSDVRDGHLREQYDAIVIAEMATRQIMDGARPGTVPGQYAGGIGDEGAEALRDFVTAGGTLITMGNAASFAIDEFNLPVANALAGLRQDQFFCSGSLLRIEIPDPKHPVVAGLPAMPAVMFERNQAFDTRPAFRGKVLASYVKDRNPLVSGYLLGAELIEGKAAALDANYGSGHIVMLGFRPQWRGQSHGTYKFLFNALYYNSSMAPERGGGGGGGRSGGRSGGGNPQQGAWRREAESVKTELTRLAELNRTYFAARGPAAAEPGKQLEATLDAFQRDRIPLLDDLRAQVEDAAIVRAEAAWSAQLKRLAVDLRTKDFSATRLEDLLDQYKLAVVP